MENEFEITWAADDYGADHHLTVSVDQFEPDMSLEQIKDRIWKKVRREFEHSVRPYSNNYADVAGEILAALQESVTAEE